MIWFFRWYYISLYVRQRTITETNSRIKTQHKSLLRIRSYRSCIKFATNSEPSTCFLALCNMTWWFGVFLKKKEKTFFLVRMIEIKNDKQIYHCLNMVYISYLCTHCTLIYLWGSPRGLGGQANIGKTSKGTREHELIFREQGNITVQIRRRKHFDIRNKYMLFTGWEVRIGRNCDGGLEYRPRPYSDHRDLKVFGKFSFTLQPMCVKVAEHSFACGQR